MGIISLRFQNLDFSRDFSNLIHGLICDVVKVELTIVDCIPTRLFADVMKANETRYSSHRGEQG